MSAETTILLAGATGLLGGKVAQALLSKPEVRLRALVREDTIAAKKPQLDTLAAVGAEIVAGDLIDLASLAEATRGVDVVISAVQGLHETIVDGQLALLEAAKRNGVRRFMPSDFAVDLFKLEPGRHPLMDLRREVDEVIAKSGLEHVHVLNGAFSEVLVEPFFRMLDLDAGTMSYWGDGDVTFDITSVADVALYTAEAALDTTLTSGKFSVAGDQITAKQAVAIAEETLGRRIEVRQQGSVVDLERWIAQIKETDPDDFWTPIFAQFQWAMVSGTARLTDLANARYPQIAPTTFAAFLAKGDQTA